MSSQLSAAGMLGSASPSRTRRLFVRSKSAEITAETASPRCPRAAPGQARRAPARPQVGHCGARAPVHRGPFDGDDAACVAADRCPDRNGGGFVQQRRGSEFAQHVAGLVHGRLAGFAEGDERLNEHDGEDEAGQRRQRGEEVLDVRSAGLGAGGRSQRAAVGGEPAGQRDEDQHEGDQAENGQVGAYAGSARIRPARARPGAGWARRGRSRARGASGR